MAVGGACGLMAAPASALELGDLKINSTLGQPLRASIAYALSSHEELYDFCVYLRPNLAADGLPVLSRATVSIADGMILLTGSHAIREPLLSMQVSIDCPYTAHISRDYTLMINPPVAVIREGPTVVEPPTRTEPGTITVSSQARKPSRPAWPGRNLDQSPISESSRYLVLRGDSVGDIASRISNRSIALWPAVDRIFAANPGAFINGDVNRLKAGSWLEIPDLSVTAQASISPGIDSIVTSTLETDADEFTVYTGYEATASTDATETTIEVVDIPDPVVTDVTEELSLTGADDGDSDFSRPEPGNVAFDSDTVFILPFAIEADNTTSIDIPDTEIIEPTATPAPAPVVINSQSNESVGKTSGSWSWLVWLGGTGLALILGLLFFGHRFKRRFGSVAVGAVSEKLLTRRQTDVSSQPLEEEDEEDVYFEVPEASTHSNDMMLDADFDDGSGLQDGSDMDVAQDFGFSASATFNEEVDEIDADDSDVAEAPENTEMIPTMKRSPTILESEVLPSDDDEYDMSMILDVTKQDVVESDATEKDLQAIQVDSESEPESDDFTLSRDVDYKILEQDYEDEFTATQVLNAEIEKAAAKLIERMDNDAAGELTANLKRKPHAVTADVDATGASASAEVTAELLGTDLDDIDITIAMEFELDDMDTKKKKKAS